VEFDSEVLAPAAARTLEEIIVRQELSQPSMCELCFASLPADYLPRPGMKVVVLLGEEKSTLFSGETSAVEYTRHPGGERLVRVRAYDLLQNLRKKHSLRAYQQMTAAGLAREMASSLGVQVSAADEGPAWATLIQHNQSDFDFLRSVARRSGLFLSLRGDTLHMLALNGLEDEIELELGGTLLEAAVEVNAALANGPVTVAAWNPLRAEPHQGEAATARSAFDGKPTADNGSVIVLANRTATDDAQASVMAQAELDLRRARSTMIVGTAEGNAALTPGSKIKVRGYPDEFANRFVLTAVTQRISRATGFVSELSSRPAEPERTPEAAILACGLVSNIHDPEQLGRVRLTLPAVGGVETDWLEVLASGAGSGKGLLCLPDVGDKVAALFAREDFSAGIVIGGLFGADGLDDYGVDEKIVRFALLTPGGHKLRFDDSKKSLRVESATGSYLEFTPDKVSLHASADMEISAPGRKMMIGAKKIDFRNL
jgi:phage protein D/phage baseplate assembly protein gpV